MSARHVAGGHARARKLSAIRRSEIARSAAQTRWQNKPTGKAGSSWPWTIVRSFKTASRADGSILIEPDYIRPYRGRDEGGGPGIFTRMLLAVWCEKRLAKRTRKSV